jgi:pseudouridine synthase
MTGSWPSGSRIPKTTSRRSTWRKCIGRSTRKPWTSCGGGFRLDGRRLKPCGIEIFEKADNPWLKVTLTEGKNQQIRRMFAAVGHPVSKLKRIKFGPLDDPFLKPGEWRFLNQNELAVLKNL